VKVSGSGASRRAAEQAAAKKALDEVMAAAPAVVAKTKRSKNARAAKHAEPEIVPGVTGVQAALDLRAPDRKAERATRGEARATGSEVAAERPVPVPASAAPLAVIRAAHVEYSNQAVAEKDKADRPERADRLDKERAERTERAAEKSEAPVRTVAEKVTEKPAGDKPAADRPAEKPAEKSPDRAEPASRATDRSADKSAATRTRELAPGAPAPAELDPGVTGAVQTRVADAGH
jgi:ribonuclease III